MTVEEALVILDKLLIDKTVNNIQELVFRQAWNGKTYPEMAVDFGYNANYLKDIGYKLWGLISNALNKKVTKSNFISLLKQLDFTNHFSCCNSSNREVSKCNSMNENEAGIYSREMGPEELALIFEIPKEEVSEQLSLATSLFLFYICKYSLKAQDIQVDSLTIFLLNSRSKVFELLNPWLINLYKWFVFLCQLYMYFPNKYMPI